MKNLLWLCLLVSVTLVSSSKVNAVEGVISSPKAAITTATEPAEADAALQPNKISLEWRSDHWIIVSQYPIRSTLTVTCYENGWGGDWVFFDDVPFAETTSSSPDFHITMIQPQSDDYYSYVF